MPPHLLTKWLLDQSYIEFQEAEALEYWQHAHKFQLPWMMGPLHQHPELSASNHFEPVGLYADEAEHTASKEKITISFLRTLSFQDSFIAFHSLEWPSIEFR